MRRVYKGLTTNNPWAVDLRRTPAEANRRKGTPVGRRIRGRPRGPAGTRDDPHVIPRTVGAEIKTEGRRLKSTAARPRFFMDPRATIGLSAGFGSTVMVVSMSTGQLCLKAKSSL
jgi:hypothetical protein